MKRTLVFVSVLFAILIWTVHCDEDNDKKPKKLQIGIKKRAESCDMKSRKGDTLHMQYRVLELFSI